MNHAEYNMNGICVFSKGGYKAAAGTRHYCVLLRNGMLYGWGANVRKQLGEWRDDIRKPIVKTPTMMLYDVKDVAVGDYHTLALLSDGTVLCWGDNGTGQLGNGNFEASGIPVKVKLCAPAKNVYASANYSLALLENGELWGWGENEGGGMLFRRSFENARLFSFTSKTPRSAVPFPMLLAEDVTSVGASRKSMAFISGKNLFVSGRRARVGGDIIEAAASLSGVFVLQSDGTLYFANIPNEKYEFSDEDLRKSLEEKEFVLEGVSQVVSCSFGALAILKGGKVTALGNNFRGLLYDGRAKHNIWHRNHDSLGKEGIAVFPDVASGISFIACSDSASILIDETGKVFVRGEDALRYFADGGERWGESVKIMDGCDEIIFGKNHALALRDGKVFSWGDNMYGQLGREHARSGNVPLPVEGLGGVIQIDSGDNTSYALDKEGNLWAWGLLPQELFDVEKGCISSSPRLLYTGVAKFIRSKGSFWDYDKIFYLNLAEGKNVLIGEGFTRYFSKIHYNVWMNGQPFEVPGGLMDLRCSVNKARLDYGDGEVYYVDDLWHSWREPSLKKTGSSMSDFEDREKSTSEDVSSENETIIEKELKFKDGRTVLCVALCLPESERESLDKAWVQALRENGAHIEDNHLVIEEDASIWYSKSEYLIIKKTTGELFEIDLGYFGYHLIEFGFFHITKTPFLKGMFPAHDVPSFSDIKDNILCDRHGNFECYKKDDGSIWTLFPKIGYGYYPFVQPDLMWEPEDVNPVPAERAKRAWGVKFKDIFPKGQAALALAEDGTLWGWGVNFDDIFSIGEPASSLSPIPIEWGVKKIVCISFYTLILFWDGSVKEYGSVVNKFSGTRSRIKPFEDRAIDIFCGYDDLVASGNDEDNLCCFVLLESGTLYRWLVFDSAAIEMGADMATLVRCETDIANVRHAGGSIEFLSKEGDIPHKIFVPPAYLQSPAYEVRNGDLFFKSGKYEYSGYGNHSFAGFVGDGTRCPKSEFSLKIMSGIRKIRGDDNFLALSEDGNIYSWGNNDFGALGTGDREERLFPYPITRPPRKKKIKMLYGIGEIGKQIKSIAGSPFSKEALVPIMNNMTEISSCHNGSLALDADGGLWYWRNGICDLPTKIDTDGKISFINAISSKTWFFTDTSDKSYFIGPFEDEQSTLPSIERLADGVKFAACNFECIYVIASDGTLSGKGSDEFCGLCGKGDSAEGYVKLMPDIETVCTHGGLIVVLSRDACVWFWGDFDWKAGYRRRKDKVQTVPRMIFENCVSVAIGNDNEIYAVTKSGKLWQASPKCGFESGELRFERILNEDVSDVVACGDGLMFIKKDRTLWKLPKKEAPYSSTVSYKNAIFICGDALCISPGDGLSFVIREVEVNGL
jgi:alpha-tubulin suppressor-like RCC1 family protein